MFFCIFAVVPLKCSYVSPSEPDTVLPHSVREPTPVAEPVKHRVNSPMNRGDKEMFK